MHIAKPHKGSSGAMDYFASCVHRTAIGNSRMEAYDREREEITIRATNRERNEPYKVTLGVDAGFAGPMR